jgi:alkylation response protein AidB-like acyl-CoA dehydrogenase
MCQKDSRGINAFIVEKAWKGVSVGAKENKLGIRGSDTHSIMFQGRLSFLRKTALGKMALGLSLR